MYMHATAENVSRPVPGAVHTPPPLRLRATNPAAGAKAALLFDAALEDSHVLIAGAAAGMGVWEFGGNDNGLAQLASWAAFAEQYDALHILCHGKPGRLQLGNLTLDRTALADAAVQDALRAIGMCLREGGSIMLYSCNLAQGKDGEAFVAELAQALGAPVAASAGLLGAAALGGHWTLEHRHGDVSATPLQWPQYMHTLATIAQPNTTFAGIPLGNNTYYDQKLGNTYLVGDTIEAFDVAGTGWDIKVATNSATNTPFNIRGVNQNSGGGYGFGDDTAIRLNSGDIDYFTFRSNQKGFYFDLTSFSIRTNNASSFTVQALDADGNVTGTAVPFSIAGSTSNAYNGDYKTFSVGSNADFVKIFGYKVTFTGSSTTDVPTLDSIVIANIGVPVLPTTKVLSATLSADSNITTDDITNITAQTISGTLDGPLQSGESVQVSFNGGVSWSTATNAVVGSNTWSTTGNLVSGANTLMARVFNADGNTAAVSRAYTLDTTVAAPSTPAMTSGTDTGIAGDAITSNTTPTFTGTGEVGATVRLYDTDGTTVRGSATVDGSGNWSITSSTLAEGNHTLTARQTDIAGNVSTASTALAVVIDTSAPAAPSAPDMRGADDTGSSSIDNITKNNTPTFTGTAESGSTVTLYDTNGSTVLGTAVATGGNWSIQSSTLSDGSHTLTAKAVDLAGNVSAASTGLTVTIDTSAPAAPSLPDLRPQDDSGDSSSDNVTNSIAPVFNGTAEAGSTVQLLDSDGITVLGTAVANGSGNWSITATGLSEGLHQLKARAFDAAGNVSPFSSTLNVTIDRTAPATPSAPDLRTLDDKGSSSADNLTNVTTPVFTGTAEANSTVTLYDTDGITVLGSAIASGGNWSITSSTLTTGDHTLTVRAVDTAGNVSSPSNSLTVTIDSTAPAALALDNTTVAAVNAGNGATIANISATDTHAITYALAVGNGSNNADNGSFNISGNTLVANGALTVGNYNIYLSATDAAGNVSYLAQTIAVVNAPSVSSIVRAGGASATVANNATSVSYTVTFSEGVSGVTSDDFTLPPTSTAGGNIVSVTPVGASTSVYTVLVDTLAGDGNLRLDLKGSGTNIKSIGSNTDIAGAYTAGAAFVLDHTAPAAPSQPAMSSGTDSGVSNSDGITSNNTPVFTGSGEIGSTVRLYDTDGSTLLGSAVVNGSGNWSITSSTLTSGNHSLTVRQTDAAGNVSVASTALAVVIDNTAPLSLALSSNTIATQSASASATIATLSAVDTTALTYALVTGPGSTSADNNSFTIAGNVLKVGGAPLSSGSYQIYLSATDAAGNVSHLAQTITVANAPTVQNIQRTGGASANVLSVSNSISFTVTFNESVTGVTTDDFTLTRGGTASGNIASISGSGAVYTVVVNTLTGDGTLQLDVNGSGSNIRNINNIEIASGYFSGASYLLDHTAPAAPPAPVVTSGTDTGISQSDGITRNTTPTFSGTAEANAIVRLYDTDGTTILGFTITDGSGNWSITSSTLSEGSHTLTLRQFDRAGNASVASSATTVVIDTSAAAPATPTLSIASDSGVTGDGITNVATPTITGTAEGNAVVTLYDTDGTTVLGTATANNSGAWSITSSTLIDGPHTLKVSQTDRAGNVSTLSSGLTITIDTTPPAAPGAPVLAPASDSGTAGDNITTVTQPVLTGTAAANATVRLYDTDGTTVLGTATADGSGNWSITSSTLSVGVHTLSARQLDAAGNVSSAGVTLSLTIEAPPPPPPTTPPSTMIDGVPVTQQTVILPGGGSGTQIVIPIITNTRTDDTGNGTLADIPLATSTVNGTSSNLLLAQIAPGIGLTAIGGASAPAGDPLQQLIQAIVAATPGHASADQGHLTGNGTTFLNQLAATVPLLVQTITPVSGTGTTGGSLTLTGTSSAGQRTALVIDSSGMGTGATLQLNAVDFAAIVGTATVVGNTNNQTLTGDQAAQQFTVSAATGSNVFSGGGSDTLVFNAIGNTQGAAAPAELRMGATIPAAATTTTSVLHGGAGIDTASFNGASSDYTIVRHQSYVTVASTAQPQQKAVLINVESLKFSDTTIAIDTNPALTAIAGLYRDTLGRQADYLGIDFWARGEQAGHSLGSIALEIILSPESQARGAKVFNGDHAHDIELLYQNIFSRHSDAEGLAFWITARENGVSLEQVATDFMTSQEMQGHKIGVPQWDFIVL